jgi:sec-independent protein translocase protein TatC
MVFPLLIASTLLFYLGVVFAYFVVFPLIFGFLTAAAPTGVAIMTDITKYLDFILTLFFAFGVCFEVPIFTIVMVWTGLVSTADLAEKRPYVIVAAFVIGAFLTPPDAISQTLLAVPMWMLFEVGLLFARLIESKDTEDHNDDEENRIIKIDK